MYQSGGASMETLDFEQKLEEAKAGNVSAMAAVGYRYATGTCGAPLDDQEAINWYRLAAERGNKVSQYNLGRRYHLGKTVQKDHKIALSWFMKAALQGYGDAQYYVGKYFSEGLAVEKNAWEAARWYRMAADNGDADAQRQLAWLYREGCGVTASETEAAKWFLKAADNGDRSAQNSIALVYKNGRGFPQDYEKAAHYMKLSAENGYLSAQCNLASWYCDGEVVEKNEQEAFRLYSLAAKSEDAGALYNLGKLYRDGIGVEKNPVEAVKYIGMAADKGDKYAQNAIALIYRNGKGVPQDFEKALHYMTLAAEQNLTASQFNLACWYRDGEVVPKDLNKALQLFLHSANQGDADAAYHCGMIYLDGTSQMEPDFERAYAWFAVATERGRKCEFPTHLTHERMNPDSKGNMRQYAVDMQSRPGSTVELVEKDLTADFGDLWKLVPETAQTSLITGVTSYVDFYNRYGNDPRIDYSASIVPMCKGLEIILNRYLREGYVIYLRDLHVNPEELKDIRGITYRSKKYDRWNFAITTEEYSLKSVPYAIFENYKGGALNDQKPPVLNTFFEQYVSNLLFKQECQGDLDAYFRELITYLDMVADTRNPSAHSAIMDWLKAEACGDILLKVKKLIYHLLDRIDPDAISE